MSEPKVTYNSTNIRKPKTVLNPKKITKSKVVSNKKNPLNTELEFLNDANQKYDLNTKKVALFPRLLNDLKNNGF